MIKSDLSVEESSSLANSGPPVIFLVNPMSGEGHLDTYARLYSAALLKLGFQVVLVTESEAGCNDWLTRQNIPRDNFSIIATYEEGPRALSSSKGQKLFGAYHPFQNSFLRTFKKWTGRILEHFPRIRAFIFEIIKKTPMSFSEGSVETLMQRVKQAEERTGLNPDIVFILYPDMLAQAKAAWTNWCYPWVCIRFAPVIGPWGVGRQVEPLFQIPTFRGACFLDEACTALYRERMPKLSFVTVPDVCDPDLSGKESATVRALREKAAGRTVVFTGGGLTGRKGLSDLIKVISLAPCEEFYFVIVGKIYWSTFPVDEAEALRRFSSALPENVMVHFGYLEDERDFNALMTAADIIYAVYRDFPYSSNMLGKAAHFESALLVSNQHLMGRQVEKYGLGATVTEGDITDILRQIKTLRNHDIKTGARLYRQAHSPRMLELALKTFLKEGLTIRREVAS